jgi:enoyl-CoA hydratase/carnithine racemase
MTDQVIIQHEDATRIITMRRPDKKNALTQDMYFAISKAIDSAQDDAAIRCMIITGSSGVFTAGNDLKDFLAAGSGAETQAFGTSGGSTLLNSLNNNKKPLIAAVDGVAVGIGTTMMFHCDYVIASKSALFSTPFVSLGLVPEGASSLLIPRALGHQRAFALMVMGRALDGEAAREAGFVNEVVAPGHVESEARKVAREICALPPEAVAISRRLLRLPPETIAERFAIEGKHFGERMQSQEALNAFKGFLGRKAG